MQNSNARSGVAAVGSSLPTDQVVISQPKTSKSVSTSTLPTPSHFRQLGRVLARWYNDNKREFLWRGDKPDPYLVLVSEVMLQQTQAARIQQLLPAFLERFPDFASLSKASNAEVIVAWKGLGYNSRALRLRDCARSVITHHDGHLPSDPELLRQLPGIGAYTAAALCAFAFQRPTIVIDVNIERITARVFRQSYDEHVQTLEPRHRSQARAKREHTEKLLELWYRHGAGNNPSDFYQALMDVGATLCQARKVDCAHCPLQSSCDSANDVVFNPKPKRAEPSFRGEANRLWRGRCVEILRRVRGHHQAATSLAHGLIGDHNAEDMTWFDKLLDGLVRDGIVERKGAMVHLRD